MSQGLGMVGMECTHNAAGDSIWSWEQPSRSRREKDSWYLLSGHRKCGFTPIGIHFDHTDKTLRMNSVLSFRYCETKSSMVGYLTPVFLFIVLFRVVSLDISLRIRKDNSYIYLFVIAIARMCETFANV